ncbi:MAG: hypothetical protein JWQ79_2493 [Mucilaginibacter sp.]|nr:hypothetical protein [Mucilaginibacter sp.]
MAAEILNGPIKSWLLSTILLLAIAMPQVHAQQKVVNNFTLSGKITNRNTGPIYLCYADKNGKFVRDSTVFKNGSFSFSGSIDQPVSGFISGHVMKSMDDEDPNLLPFFLEPGEMTITLAANDFKHAEITGSSAQRDRETLNQQIKNKPFSRTLDSLYKLWRTLLAASKSDDKPTDLNLISYQIARYRDSVKKVELVFAAKNPQSYLMPFLVQLYLQQQRLTVDSAEMLYNGFVPSVQQSKYGKSLNEIISRMKLTLPGAVAPLFVKKSMDGSNLGLASFNGKNYVLLDFWASWCEPCREFTPKIKEAYQQYHNKGLEIISVSWDDDEAAWKKAVAEDGIEIWHNVIASLSGPNDNSMRDKYSIPFIPTLILIDKNGIIIGRYDNGDEAAALKSKLRKIFDK